MNLLSTFFRTISISVMELIYLLGIIIAIGFILGLLERSARGFWLRALGHKGVLLTAYIGTPIHELGHFVMCLLFGHRVTRMKLLQLHSPDGVLGYVQHQYNRNSLYQQAGNFFIGIGPIFSGIASLVLAMYLLVPQSFQTFQNQIEQLNLLHTGDIAAIKMAGTASFMISKALFTLENFTHPGFWLFLLLGIAISSHIALSRADIENSAKGLLIIFLLLVLFNIAALILGIDSLKFIARLAEYNAYLVAFSSIALLFSFITLAIGYVLCKIKGA